MILNFENGGMFSSLLMAGLMVGQQEYIFPCSHWVLRGELNFFTAITDQRSRKTFELIGTMNYLGELFTALAAERRNDFWTA